MALAAVTAMGAMLAPSFASSAESLHSSGGSKGTTNADDTSPADVIKLDLIQQLRDLADAAPTTFAGISTNGANSVTVHLVVGASLPSAAETVINQLDAQGSTVNSDFRPRSLAELQKTLDGVTSGSTLKALGAAFASAQIDPDTDTVLVGLNQTPVSDQAATTRVNDEVSQIQSQFGKAVAFQTVDKPIYAASRTTDTSPFYGGDGVFPAPSGACTSGFSILNASGTPYATIAGHCGTIGTAIKTGGVSRPGTRTFGTIDFNGLYNGQDFDIALVGGTNYAGYTWIGGASTSTYQPNAKVQNSCAGCRVDFDGAVTGQVNHAILDGGPATVNLCAAPNVDCHIGKYTQKVHSDNGASLCQGGDSGGPVLVGNGHAQLIAIGLIRGCSGDGTLAYYTQLQPALTYWKSSLLLGA